MKSLIFLIALISLITSQNLRKSVDEFHGCKIPEGQDKCCWTNRNGCCAPVSPETLCTDALKLCCKTKYYDEETQTYKYKYN